MGDVAIQPAPHEPPLPLVPTSQSGNWFSSAHNFSISGGTFTSNVQTIADESPKGKQLWSACIDSSHLSHQDFRSIPLGDINLLREIVHRQSRRVSRRGSAKVVRKLYSATVGSLSVTAVVYYGDEAAKEVCVPQIGSSP